MKRDPLLSQVTEAEIQLVLINERSSVKVESPSDQSYQTLSSSGLCGSIICAHGSQVCRTAMSRTNRGQKWLLNHPGEISFLWKIKNPRKSVGLAFGV